MGKLYFKYGAMNSGKSTTLIQTAHNYEERGMKVLVIKPKIDNKGEDYIVSRIGVKRKVDYLIEEDDNIFETIGKYCMNIACILVDEVQFLKEEQIDELLQLTIKFDIPVICFGIRTDFQTKGFSGSRRLLEVASKIEELKTVCSCGKKATFNTRKINNKFTFSGNQVAIDEQKNISYVSLCPKCYYEKFEKYKKIQNILKNN